MLEVIVNSTSMKTRAAHLLQSSTSTVLLSVITVLLAGLWCCSSVVRGRAPVLRGYNWGAHSKAVLIVVPPGECGCGASPSDLAREALAQNLDVVVVFSSTNPAIELMKRGKWPRERVFIASVEPTLVNQFAPGKTLTLTQVVNGRVVLQTQGPVALEFVRSMTS